MRNFIKKISLILLLMFLVFTFVNGAVFAKEKVIVVTGSWIENNITGTGSGVGRNLAEELSLKHNIELEFHLIPSTAAHQEMLFRIGSLLECEEDLIYVLDSAADERIINLLTPLDEYLKEKPLEGFPEDYSEGMLNAYRKKGLLYSIPMRGGVWVLWYNKRILEESRL